MGQMDIKGSGTSTIEIEKFDGLNTALSFTELKPTESLDMLNALPGSLGTLAKRPGTIPLTDNKLNNPIERIFNLRKTTVIQTQGAPTLANESNTSSALSGGTYYVQYTYVTDDGETDPSVESSISVPSSLADPTTAPTLAQSANSNETLTDQTYYVAYTWKNGVGETLVSSEASITITAGNQMDITVPTFPADATKAGIYIGTTSGTLYFQKDITTTTTSITSDISTTTGTPSTNTTQAQLKVTIPAIPFHANSANIYISATSGTETLQGNITTTTYTQTSDLVSGNSAPTTNTTEFRNDLLATSNKTLYSYYNDKFNPATMTNGFLTNDVDNSQFKDENGAEVLVITDGGDLKYYDGTEVANVTPAADDPDIEANDLTNINANNPPIGCLVHNTRVVIWDGSDTIWHSRIGYYDYFKPTDYQRFVRKNDYVQTCVSYRGALIILMRRHAGVLFGQDKGNWKQDFLDTDEGCLNPKTVQTVTFPDGNQEIFYLSDNGVQSIYALDTLALDSSARYSTRSITEKRINWGALGVTQAEWQQASAHFFKGKYWLLYPKGTEWKGLVFDTTYQNWYAIDSIQANDFYHDNDDLIFVTDNGEVKQFDDTLYSDWDDTAKTSGTPINWYWYSTLLTPGITGFDHMWDILMVEAKQFKRKSTIDLEVNTLRGQHLRNKAIKTAVLIWGETDWGEAQWANTNMTELVNNAKRERTFLKGQYAQIKLSNNRDEPVEVVTIKYDVRKMG